MAPRTDPLVDLLDRRMDARIEAAIVAAQRPIFVHQRSVERVLGLPGEEYLEAARAGEFETWRRKRLTFARTSDVASYLESFPSAKSAVASPANDAEAVALARVGARRVSS
jgi:hypothetical protein